MEYHPSFDYHWQLVSSFLPLALPKRVCHNNELETRLKSIADKIHRLQQRGHRRSIGGARADVVQTHDTLGIDQHVPA